jgi:predicted nucleic acid-binding protein
VPPRPPPSVVRVHSGTTLCAQLLVAGANRVFSLSVCARGVGYLRVYLDSQSEKVRFWSPQGLLTILKGDSVNSKKREEVEKEKENPTRTSGDLTITDH